MKKKLEKSEIIYVAGGSSSRVEFMEDIRKFCLEMFAMSGAFVTIGSIFIPAGEVLPIVIPGRGNVVISKQVVLFASSIVGGFFGAAFSNIWGRNKNIPTVQSQESRNG